MHSELVSVNFNSLSEDERAKIREAGTAGLNHKAFMAVQVLDILAQGDAWQSQKAREKLAEDHIIGFTAEQYIALATLLDWELPETRPQLFPEDIQSYPDELPEWLPGVDDIA